MQENQNLENKNQQGSGPSSSGTNSQNHSHQTSQTDHHDRSTDQNQRPDYTKKDDQAYGRESDGSGTQEKVFEKDIIHDLQGTRATGRYFNALAKFDPLIKEIQLSDHWTFKDPELEKDGYF